MSRVARFVIEAALLGLVVALANVGPETPGWRIAGYVLIVVAFGVFEFVYGWPRAAENPPVPSSPAPEPAAPPSSEQADPLDNKPWLNLVRECVNLFDELDRHRAGFDPARQEVADHVLCRLQEILERSSVEPITGEKDFNRNRHQPDGVTRVDGSAVVVETLSPGFAAGRLILRRARVRLELVTERGKPT